MSAYVALQRPTLEPVWNQRRLAEWQPRRSPSNELGCRELCASNWTPGASRLGIEREATQGAYSGDCGSLLIAYPDRVRDGPGESGRKDAAAAGALGLATHHDNGTQT